MIILQMLKDAMSLNESHVCDVALSPTRAKGHVAERHAAAPRSPSRPAGVPMYIRAVIRSCADSLFLFMYAVALHTGRYFIQ